MADSDNSTTLSFVTYRSDSSGRSLDVARVLAYRWQQANGRVKAFGMFKDNLEKRVLRQSRAEVVDAPDGKMAPRTAGDWARLDANPRYRGLRDAEFAAMTAEESLIDFLPSLEAQSLDGIVAKLEMIVGADGLIEDPEAFPLPQIRSVLADLRRLASDG